MEISTSREWRYQRRVSGDINVVNARGLRHSHLYLRDGRLPHRSVPDAKACYALEKRTGVSRLFGETDGGFTFVCGCVSGRCRLSVRA